jgi:magnesium-transporting ATPase (P-type)
LNIPALKNSKSWRKKMNNNKINLIGWILFIISAVGFIISSIGSFWAMFGSIFFFIACFVFLIPFFRKKKD